MLVAFLLPEEDRIPIRIYNLKIHLTVITCKFIIYRFNKNKHQIKEYHFGVDVVIYFLRVCDLHRFKISIFAK